MRHSCASLTTFDLLDFRAVGDDKWQIAFTAGYGIGWKIRLTHPTHVLRIKSFYAQLFCAVRVASIFLRRRKGGHGVGYAFVR
jgi:hypothetical protein